MADIKFNGTMLSKWRKEMTKLMKVRYPSLSKKEIHEYLDRVLLHYYKDEPVKFYNNYLNTVKTSTCSNIEEFYYSDVKPVATEHGVFYRSNPENPATKTLNMLKKERKEFKRLRDASPAGSKQYAMFDLYQNLKKIAMNSYYGASGARQSVFYNIHSALSVTGKGQAIISTATQAFEAFLANNSKFVTMDECLVFIKNVISEKKSRKFNDDEILDGDVPLEKVRHKLKKTFLYKSRIDESLLNRILLNLSQEDLNRLYYKNNLYAFVNKNSKIKNLIRSIIIDATPLHFSDPNKPDPSIQDELDILWAYMKEYVFYNYMIKDRVYRLKNYKRKAVVVIDTDSNMLNLEPWLLYSMDKIIKPEDYDDFEEFRLASLNTLMYVLSQVISETLYKFSKLSNIPEEKRRLIRMKNEYLYKRMIISNGKKNYTGVVEYKEGKWMNYDLDIKGLPLDKISSNKESSAVFKDILKKDMLMSDKIDIPKILNKLQNFQDEMEESLKRGEKRFLKPATVKQPKYYADPLTSQQYRALMNWNIAYPDKPVELPDSIYIVKMTMTSRKDLETIRDSHPDIYERLKTEIFESTEKRIADKGVHVLGIPRFEDEIPDWAIPFIDSATIVQDNMKNIVSILEVLDIQPLSVTSNAPNNKEIQFSNIVNF